MILFPVTVSFSQQGSRVVGWKVGCSSKVVGEEGKKAQPVRRYLCLKRRQEYDTRAL